MITRQMAYIQKSKQYAGILPGSGNCTPGRTDSMIELYTLVPDRIPDGISNAGYVRLVAMYKQDIEVAVRIQLSSPVPSHGQKRYASYSSRSLSDSTQERFFDPSIRFGGIQATPIQSPSTCIGQELFTSALKRVF